MVFFLIFFRESLEAALVCSIMFGYLSMVGRNEHFKDIWLGILSGVFVSLVGGSLIYLTIANNLHSDLQNIIEAISYLLACGVLTYMTIWIKNHENLKNELDSKMKSTLDKNSMFAVYFFVFLTIGREGLEIIVFTLPIALISKPIINVLGAVLGVISGISLGYIIYRLEKTINLKKFNRIISILFMFLGASLLVNGIEIFQGLGWLPFGSEQLWTTASILSEKSELGDLLHSFIGYTDSPTSLQLICYAGYLTVVFALRQFRKSKME